MRKITEEETRFGSGKGSSGCFRKIFRLRAGYCVPEVPDFMRLV